jgi:hypothetical protein
LAGSLKTVADELTGYTLDLVAVQEVRLIEGGSQRAASNTFFHGIGNANHHLGTDFFVHKSVISAVKRVEFISNRTFYNTKRLLMWYYSVCACIN